MIKIQIENEDVIPLRNEILERGEMLIKELS